ncbi:hypothetical protein V5O48_014807 [Marasmius crinis-equi]|uniref:Uncharacterized protein n=1 Tax=Marasmius crinis-equi TaxID=585013 RepID=A0ABR3EWC3_9AGAR
MSTPNPTPAAPTEARASSSKEPFPRVERNAAEEGQGKENKKEDEGDREDEGEDEEDELKNISTIHPEKVAYFEALLPTFLALPARSREKNVFWEAFPPPFLARFPLDKYPAPSDTLSPLPELSAAQRQVLTRQQKDARKKAERRRRLMPEQRAVEQAKRWFLYQQAKGGRRANKMDRYLKKQLYSGSNPPCKLPIGQFITSHPDHKRKEYLRDGLSEEEKKQLVQERDERFELRRANWKADSPSDDISLEEQAVFRENLPRVLQPILEACSRFTGMSLFLQGGVELDHPDQASEFDVLSLCAVPNRCPTFDQFGLAEYSAFNTHFLGWIQAIERIKLGLSELTAAIPAPDGLEGLIQMNQDESNHVSEPKPKRKKARGKGKQKAKEGGSNLKKWKGKKGLKSRKKADDNDDETAEEDPNLDLNDNSTEDEVMKEDGMKGDRVEEDELDEEEEEEDGLDNEHPRGPPMSAYEIQREENIKTIRQIWKDLDGPEAVASLKEGLAQPTRPKPKRKTQDRVDVPPSNMVRRSQQSSANTSTASTSVSPNVEGVPVEKSPTPAPAADPVDSAITSNAGSASSAGSNPVRAQSLAPAISDPSEAIQPVLRQSDDTTSPLPAPQHPPEAAAEEPEPQHQPAAGQAPEEPRSISSPSGTVAPPGPDALTTSPRLRFLEACHSVTVDFDPLVDKILPSAYEGKKTELVQKLGEWLFKIPEGCSFETCPVVYGAVVCKWMELEHVTLPLHAAQKLSRHDSEMGGKRDLRVNLPRLALRIDGKVVPGGEGDWEECEFPGKLGIGLVVVALKWWHDVGGVDDEESNWQEAAKSLYYVLDCMLSERRKTAQPRIPAVRNAPDTPPLDGDDRRKRRRTE